MACLVYTAWILWLRGYPDQALERIRAALTLAQQCKHPFCLAFALTFAVVLSQCRREIQAVSMQADSQSHPRTPAGVSPSCGYGYGVAGLGPG